MTRRTSRRRFLAPEVVQTSGMDCGPAALKCLLEGFGTRVSYGRLREACQTDVDGTSIDTLEEIARSLGFDAEQVMVPVEHLALSEATPLPCLLIVRLPNGFTHFLVVWRRLGPWVQLMDPARGRRWTTWEALIEETYVHEMRIAARTFADWAQTDGFRRPLELRLRASCGTHAGSVPADGKMLAAFDAALRFVEHVIRSGGVRRGREAARVLHSLLSTASPVAAGSRSPTTIPDAFWFARPAPKVAGADGEDEVVLRGAVGVLVAGPRPADESSPAEPPASAALRAALAEPPTRPMAACFEMLRGDGAFSVGAIGAGLAVAAGAVAFEGWLFRGLVDISSEIQAKPQRLGAALALVTFLMALFAVEFGMVAALKRLGRRLEMRFRSRFLERIPRLHDRYFQSRPVSDMAERAHSLHELRQLPILGGRCVRTAMSLVATVCAIAWLDPFAGLLAIGVTAGVLGWPLIFEPRLAEHELRQRTHRGALGQFFLDVLLGLSAARAHRAERALRREHEGLVVEWAQTGRHLLDTVLRLETVQMLWGYGGAALLVIVYCTQHTEATAALLLAYWALFLPVLGEEFTYLIRLYPVQRNATLRALEPLGAATTEETIETESARLGNLTRGVAIEIANVDVQVAGHRVLENLELTIAAGEHIAIVGPSGSGKSSLIGLLLGWHKPSAGVVCIDHAPLDSARQAELHEHTVWVDPSVQLWNDSLLENLLYGANDDDATPGAVASVLEQSELRSLLEHLPSGLQSQLGDGGGRLSGGEGQRVRFARGLLRKSARLVILDEPFRGLDRSQRRALLARARHVFAGATLLCATHDVADTQEFARVLVLESGRIVEDGAPATLAATSESRYGAAIAAERSVHETLWTHPAWRRVRIAAGRVSELSTSEASS